MLKLKGEFGVFIVSDGTNQPYRVKLRAPGFVHLSAMERITKGSASRRFGNFGVVRHCFWGDR